jgi:hypothetical protein
MAAYNKFNAFTTDLTNGKHDFSSHTYKVMLTDTAPVATNTIKANITEISVGNGYLAGGLATTISKSNTSGTEKIVATDVVFAATGNSIGPFRYAVLYNDTQTTPSKPLVAWFDYGSETTLNTGESFTVDFDGTNGLFTLG